MTNEKLNNTITSTIEYYNKNAEHFMEETVTADFTAIQEMFLSLLPPGGRILDFGCGSGRDTLAFLKRGYQVDATDGSTEMCKLAAEYTGIPVRQMQFQELSVREHYDGIWACSSILHLPENELKNVIGKMETALNRCGIIYASFKYGTFAGERNERYFTDFTEESFETFVKQIKGLKIKKMWITGDVRVGREKEKWLNILLRKQIIS
ncbi:SAM-dependent methyltransferase [Eubacterium sp. An11]|uniref:class I SAM-dependent methyltransferase n=1 Tax=Eubacterium sp. An11 TaxID=1965542 RepID=UPI000B38E9FE|nr:class I SAM-dependent methyltransferase [Eubacterium sp. An11]OUQ65610.1 SAM-dependent methyltransferase [Eubacterium sp. An11]